MMHIKHITSLLDGFVLIVVRCVGTSLGTLLPLPEIYDIISSVSVEVCGK